MEKKTCCKCGKEKKIEGFNKRGKYYQPWCRACMNKNAKEHYQQNKKLYTNKNERLVQAAVEYVRDIKSKSCCIECGENHIATLHFHHRNPLEKKFELAKIYGTCYSLKTIKKEIEKCDILCANCHAKKHWEENKTIPFHV